jgi:Tfp pilus assembly protein PilO
MKNLSLKTKLWIFAGICIVSTLATWIHFYMYKFKPYQLESEKLDVVLEMKKLELTRIMAQNQRKGELQKEIKRATEDFKRLKEMFPDKDFIPSRLQDLTKASRQSSVLPVSFKPQLIVEKEFYIENNYEVTVASSYHGLGSFFEKIANFRYPTALTNVSIVQNKIKEQSSNTFHDIANTVTVAFQLKTFTSKK